MTLSLTMLRCPGGVPPQSRTVEGGEFAVGRGPENDWVLPDPERYLSKRHCVLSCDDGTWKITDYSTNGTFINRDRTPLGRGQVRELNDGDRLHMGTYEIEIRVLEHGIPKPGGAKPGPVLELEPLASDIIERQPGLDSLLQTRTAVDTSGTRKAAMRLPADYDPLAPDPDIDGGLLGPVPRVVLPEDWNLDTDAPEPATVAPRLAGPHGDGTASQDLMAAFMKGARLDHEPSPSSAAAMEALGVIFREMVYGLREVMIARAKLKGQFRIEQTGIRTRGNNPLKFSANDDDALSALMSGVRQGDKGVAALVSDALNDIRLHEIATVAAMQTAAGELLAELDPAKLRETGDAGFNLVSAQRKARAWDAFEAQYERLSKSLGDGLDSAFGRAFARAYEQALAEGAGKKNH